MGNYNSTDFYFSADGDFLLSENKDVMDTSTNSQRSFTQEIYSRLNFRKGEWPGAPTVGIDLSDFIGKPNTAEQADKIKFRVIMALTMGGFISTNDLLVDVIPLSNFLVLVKITVRSGNNIVPYFMRYSLREKSFGEKGDLG